MYGSLIKRAFLALALLFSPLIGAQDAASTLTGLLQGYQSFSARFEQISRSDQNVNAEILEGQLHVERPDKFRWETQIPFPQLIISDSSYLWIYDPDLEQATRKNLSSQSNGAALILNGKTAELKQQFEIYQLIDTENEALFELIPKDENSNFQRLRLFFSNGIMSEMLLQDALGQQTTILFHNPEINISLDPALFQFEPDDTTDVIISAE